MKANRPYRALFIATSALVLAGCGQDVTSSLSPEPSARPLAAKSEEPRVTRRSIEEFAAAQGTFCTMAGSDCFPIFAPAPELFAWINGPVTASGMVDYTGQTAAWLESASGGAISLGTTIDGSVTERLLKDGRVEVHVVLRTSNALMWAGSGLYVAGDPVTFGASPAEVLAGATPALGSSTLKATYITTAAGLPFPDLVQIAFAPEPGQEDVKVSFDADATGVLREGSGFPAGTMGRLVIHQIGIFHTKSPSKAENPFVVERVELKANGK